MSWLFGEIIVGSNPSSDFSRIVSNNKVLHSHSSENVNLIAGGNSRNLFSFKISDKSIFVAGIGIDNSGITSKILDRIGWKSVLSRGIEEALSMDGHFVIIIVEEREVKIFTDRLGLRDIYIRELQDRIIISTKIKWLTLFGELEINYSEFSSRWMLFNQISQESIFKNTKRIVAGKSVSIKINQNYEINFSNYKREYSNTPFSAEEYISKLTSLINLNIQSSEKLSLSLSGGMDSRVILSILMNRRNDFFETHSFGNSKHPDSEMAVQITDILNVSHHQYNSQNMDTDRLLRDIEDYTTESVINNSASGIIQLRNYKFLIERNLVVIDGGYGEIWRREFFYKLLIKGKKALLNEDIDKIIPNLTIPRADIFSEEIIREMEQGVKSQIGNIINILPKISKNNIESWLDIFALETRLPNYYSHEQTRLDEMITGIMPFAQQSLISNLLGVNIEEKKNGKLFRRIIKQNYPKLTQYSLIKGTTKHPYNLNSIQSRIWSLVLKKMGKNYKEVSNIEILLPLVKEFIFDTTHSRALIESGVYDKEKVYNMVEGYYNGSIQNSYSLDWLLAFILFNKSISRF